MNNPEEFVACLSTQTASMRLKDFQVLSRALRAHVCEHELWRFAASKELRNQLAEHPSIIGRAYQVLHQAWDLGAEILYPGHPNYPWTFSHLRRPPLFLSHWGHAPWIGDFGLAVVGSREPTREAMSWLELNLPRVLDIGGVQIVSGAARGIDQLAHAIALRCDKATTAFLPSGLAQVYPRSFTEYLRPIIEKGGAVLSEFAPDEPMKRHHFERRNRLIAAMASLVFIVEARQKSGTLLTARLATEFGVDICALPSSPLKAQTLGSLDLIADGVRPILYAEDLVEMILSVPKAPQRELAIEGAELLSAMPCEETKLPLS